MDVKDLMNELADKVSSSTNLSLICGIQTPEIGLKLLCHGRGEQILTMMVFAIKRISDDTGRPGAALVADIAKALIALEMMEEEDHE